MAKVFEENKQQVAECITFEMGKPINESIR